MTGILTINGVSCANYGVYLSEAGVYNKAEKDISFVSVPGRSGDLTFDNNRFKNTTITYPCVIAENFSLNFPAFINFLQSQKGYMRLEDSFYPDEYMMGILTKEVNPKRTADGEIGTFELSFNRKPQRFLKSGELAFSVASGSAIMNLGEMTAKPLVRAYGTGAVSIGGRTITISTANGYTDIDCEIQSAYKGSTNCNGNITLNSGEFFELKPGSNGVTFTCSSVEITPRWWRL